MYKYVGSSKYAPLTNLPSQLLPPVNLSPTAVYRPRWQQDIKQEPTSEPEQENHRTTGEWNAQVMNIPHRSHHV